jgi:hypothetical protein
MDTRKGNQMTTLETLFDVCIRIPAKLVGPLMQLVSPEGEVISFTQAHTPRRRHTRRRSPPAYATRDSGVKTPLKGRDFLLHLLAGGHEWPVAKIRDAFVADGRAANSCTPQLSFLQRTGKIARVREGVYRIAAVPR